MTIIDYGQTRSQTQKSDIIAKAETRKHLQQVQPQSCMQGLSGSL